MKYERLTEKRETPLVMSMWGGTSKELKIYNRLAELEDKIECGEFVSKDWHDEQVLHAENRIAELEKEIKGNAFYAKGYAQGIKNTYEVVVPDKLKQFAERVKMEFYYEFDEIIPSIMSDKIDKILKELIEE